MNKLTSNIYQFTQYIIRDHRVVLPSHLFSSCTNLITKRTFTLCIYALRGDGPLPFVCACVWPKRSQGYQEPDTESEFKRGNTHKA